MSYCQISGNVVDFTGGTLQPGAILKVFKVLSQAGSVISSTPRQYTFMADGSWSPLLRLERDSYAYIYLNAPGFDTNKETGIPLAIPNTATATLASLSADVNLPTEVPVVLQDLALNVVIADNVETADTYATLPDAITAIGSNVRTLVISSQQNLTDDLTVPKNVTTSFTGEGSISIASGKTLTINGPLVAAPRQIFSGSGSVKFGSLIGVVYPEWFGAIGDGDSANASVNTTAIQAALDAFNPATPTLYTDVARAGIVELTGGYWISDTIVLKWASHTLRGQGWGTSSASVHRSYLRATSALAGKPMIKVMDSWGTGIEKLFLVGHATSKPSCAIEFNRSTAGSPAHGLDHSYLSHVFIGDMGGYSSINGKQFTDGIIFTGGLDGDSNSFRHVSIAGCDNSGVDNTGNSNAADSHWDTLIVINCGIGFKNGTIVVGTNWLFALNGVDISQAGAGAHLTLTHFTSEGSGRLMTCTINGTHFNGTDINFGLDPTTFTPADSGNDRWLIDAMNSYTNNIKLEDFFVANFTGTVVKNPVIRMGNNGGAADVVLRIKNTNLPITNIRVEPYGGTGDYIFNFVEYENTRAQSGITSFARAFNLINGNRGAEDASLQAFRYDILGKANIFSGPLKVKAAWKPSSVTASASVGSGATNYSYKVTALTYDGETEPSTAATCTNAASLGSSNKNLILWRPVVGAYAYNVYGRTSGSELLMATIPADRVFDLSTTFAGISQGGSSSGWIDDGSVTPSGALPTVNTTGNFWVEGGMYAIDTTPAQITANKNNYVISSNTIQRLSSDASRDITGISGGTQGRLVTLINVGSQNIVIKNQDTNSTDINRFLTGTGGDITLAGDAVLNLWYDSTTQRWRVVSAH